MNHLRFLFNISLLVTLLVSLSGCGGLSSCVDADDFGFTTIAVSSRYDPDEIVGENENQVAPWMDHDLKLSGKALVIMIRNWQYGDDYNSKRSLSAWCPWWGTEEFSNTLSPYCLRLRQCKYLKDEMCYSIPPHTITDENPAIMNAPCLLKKGVGLYAALQKPGEPSPNDSVVSMKDPNAITLHLGEPVTGFKFYDYSNKGIIKEAGGIRYNYDGGHGSYSSRTNYVNGKLYLKILDSHYDDNSGQYIAVIKSGLHEPGGDIFSLIRRMVKEKLFGTGKTGDVQLKKDGVIRTIFQNIITQPGYILAVRAALILYISITALMFVMGSIQLTHAEVVNRVFKVAVITALLSPAISWDFFNDYLFIWMYEGSDFLIQILYDAAKTGPGDSSILTFLTSPQIMAKLASLLFSTWQGWIYITLYIVMLIFLTLVLFNATILYLSALIMLGLLIALGPIFIAFYLFESTKSFFENWLKQMIGYAIQSVIVAAGILFMTMIIRNQVYNTLGFRACLHQFPHMDIATGGLGELSGGSDVDKSEGMISIFSWWFPHIPSWSNAPPKTKILIPKAHFRAPSDAALGFDFKNEPKPEAGDFCPAYECVGERHPDLPFLDPNNPYEKNQMDLLRSSEIIDFGGLFIIAVCVFLLHHFNTTTVSIAKFLSGTTANIGDTSAVADTAAKKLWQTPLKYLDKKSGLKQKRKDIKKYVHNYWEKQVLDKSRDEMANWHAKRLRDQAMRESGTLSGSSKEVVRKVQSKYGLSQSDARKFKLNMSNHADGLKEAVGGTKADGSKFNSKKFVEKLSVRTVGDFDSMMAKDYFGKQKLSDLSASEQRKLSMIKESGSVQEMLKNKQKADLYQRAYVDSYTEMANKDSGRLTAKQKRQHNIQSRSKKNSALADELKRYMTGGLIGGEYDEMSYKDKLRRTKNEMIADKDDIVESKIAKEKLDKMTVRIGLDVQRPDFLASERERLGGGSTEYDKVIKQNIKHDVHQKLKSTGAIMGDTYIREKMSDKEFEDMINNLHGLGESIYENDDYIRQESIYEGNQGALDELEHRKDHIKGSIQDEIQRLHDVRGGDGKKDSLFGDVKSKGKGIAGKINDIRPKKK